MAVIDVDLEKFGARAALVQVYLDEVNAVNEIDEKLGTNPANPIDELKNNYPEAVQRANEILESIKNMSGDERVVIAHLVSRDRSISKIATDYIAANAPKEEALKVSANVAEQLYEERKNHVFQAKHMFASLEALFKGTPEFEELPECPQGIRGGAPGKRGPMGRKLPSNVVWTITGVDGITETHEGLKTSDVASLVGMKSAGELRREIQKAYPETLPNEFQINVNGRTLKGSTVSSNGSTVEEDDDDEPTEGTEELSFEDD